MPRFDSQIPEIEWRDISPPGSRYEVQGAPCPESPGETIYRHRRRDSMLPSESCCNFMTRGPWLRDLPQE